MSLEQQVTVLKTSAPVQVQHQSEDLNSKVLQELENLEMKYRQSEEDIRAEN